MPSSEKMAVFPVMFRSCPLGLTPAGTKLPAKVPISPSIKAVEPPP
jgi:hypothetical protein